MAVIGDVEDEQVSLLAGLEGAYGVGTVDGSCGVESGSDNSLGGGQAHVAAGQGDGKLHVATPGSARVEVACQCQQATGFEDRPSGGIVMLCQAKRGTGQCHCDRIGAGKGVNIRWGGLDQMVGRGGAQLGCQAGASQVVELIGMDLEREAQGLGSY